MNSAKHAIIYAIEDSKNNSCKRQKKQVYKILLSDVLDDNGNCFISEMYEKDGSGWKEIECGGYIVTDSQNDVFDFFNKHGIDLRSKVEDWNHILGKEIMILL